MDTVFIQRHVAGVGVARLCLGRPVRQPRATLSTESEVPVRFEAGQCFGVLWWVAGGNDRHDVRVLAIGRAANRPLAPLMLPGFSRAIEVRVFLEQAGPPGTPGPLSPYLDAAEEASLLGRPLPPLSIACYRRLAPALSVSETTLARLQAIFDYPLDTFPRRLAEPVRRLVGARNPQERQWQGNGRGRCPIPSGRRSRSGLAVNTVRE
jgi:hypothetical protein